MDSNARGPLKPRVLALVAQGQAEQEAFIAQLSAAERAAPGAPDAWAAKDHIAHNAAWKADAARKIAAATRGETPERSPSSTVFNPRVFAEQQHQSWDAVLGDMKQADAALRAALEACSEDDLADPARFPWREGYPLWARALVSGYEHPAEHYAQFYLEMGDLARARSVREEAVETARRFVGEREEFGYMVYNLGCFHAQTGRPDLAIAAIREALAGTPGLREGIQEDPELVSLRDYPGFQALVADAPASAAEQRNQ